MESIKFSIFLFFFFIECSLSAASKDQDKFKLSCSHPILLLIASSRNENQKDFYSGEQFYNQTYFQSHRKAGRGFLYIGSFPTLFLLTYKGERCNAFEDECVGHAELKRDHRRRTHSDIPTNIQFSKCGVCERIPLSRAGYANYLKVHHENQKEVNYATVPTCFILLPAISMYVCKKICRSSSRLRSHMMIHKRFVGPTHPINPIKDTGYINHICMIPEKSYTGPKSHRRGQGFSK